MSIRNKGLMVSKCLISAAVVATCGTVAGNANASVIANGSFEAGLSNWTLSSSDPGATYSLASNFGHIGTHSVQFGQTANGFNIGLAQALVAPGGDYELTFWIYNLGVGNDSLFGTMQTTGADSLFGLYISGVTTELESWVQVSVGFTGLDPVTGIRFSGHDNNAAFYIDDIELNAVPAPVACAPLALAGLWSARRRR